jgi:type I restriction enzyme S subunit
MNLREVKISELAQMKYGKMPSKEILSDEGYPIFSGYRVTGYAKEYLYKEPKLILVARGVGGTGDVKISPPESWITNLSIVLNLNNELIDQNYLYYKLSREPLKDKLNTGAAQAQITIETLGAYKIKIPNLGTQQEIARIIKRYDDLIENNRRRIQLLEESARLLYKEWFVHLRFPMHEHVKIKNGMPEGWERSRVADLGDVVTGKTPSTKDPDNFDGEVMFIKTPDMHGTPIVIYSEQYLSEKGASTQANKYIPEGSIMVTCIGTVGIVAFNGYRAQTNQQINSIIPKEPELRYYSYFALSDLKSRMEAIGGGATMANINKAKFESLPIVIPNKIVLSNFNEFCLPMFEYIKLLQLQNNKLREARDLLLPRLMNGEIAV